VAIDDLRLAIRRRPVALAAIFLSLTALAAFRLGDPPPRVPVASTKVVVLPDPRAPISTATPVLPAYQTFGTKVGSIETGPVLRRAARIALGERAFTSPELLVDHLRPAREGGIAAARARAGGEGEEAVEALALELSRSLSVHAIARQQIVEIRVAAETPAEAAFLSWAVAEAAHQHHGERMRREADAMRARLVDEIARIRARLEEVVAEERAVAAPTLERLEARGRLLAVLATQLGEEEVRLRVAGARHRLGFSLDGLDPLTPPAIWLQERHLLALALESARFEQLVRSTSLASRHPDLQRQETEVRTLAARLARLDAAKNAFGERQRAAVLRRDRLRISIEHSVLVERRERLEEETRAWRREVAGARAGGESQAVGRELAALATLERRVRWFAEGLGSPIVLLSPAMGAYRPPPPLSRGLLLALIAGVALIATLAGAAARERWRDVLRGRRDVEERLGLPLLGVIPAAHASLADPATPEEATTAGISALAAGLSAAVGAPERRVVAVASASAGEGRTTVAVEVAAALARRGRRVVIVDGDLRTPGIAARLGLPPGPGLATCLLGTASGAPVLEEIFETALPGLDALPSAPLTGDALAILDPARLRELFAALADRYDLVIVDTPSLARAGDVLSIAGAVDGVLLVAASHRTLRSKVAEARRVLESAGGRVLGAVLAGFPSSPEAAFSRRAEGELFLPPADRVRRSIAV